MTCAWPYVVSYDDPLKCSFVALPRDGVATFITPAAGRNRHADEAPVRSYPPRLHACERKELSS